MAVSDYALITLAEAKVFPGLAALPAADEGVVEALIDAVSFDFEAYWDNYGVQRAVAERYTYREIIRESPNYDTIWLRRYPIISVSDIRDQYANTITSSDYWIDADVGALRCTEWAGWDVPTNSGGYNTYWTIGYTAGHVANTAAVPANIKLAAKMRIAQLYKSPTQDVSAKSVEDLSITYKQAGGMSGSEDTGLPIAIQRLIAPWKKREA